MTAHAPPYGQALTYIACDVPEGMHLATWRKASAAPRRRRRVLRPLRRPR